MFRYPNVETADITADTVTEIALPDSCSYFQIKMRGGSAFLLAFKSTVDGGIPASGAGDSSNKYVSVPSGSAFELEIDRAVKQSIFVRCSVTEIAEISWAKDSSAVS